ncbi:MAG: hypothetical protein LBR25_05320 [Erysipelotrichaceae bacterium]|jgi:hypothetical protein|nr:hypothetical protein [Erysipelotrichaceae bacterium]
MRKELKDRLRNYYPDIDAYVSLIRQCETALKKLNLSALLTDEAFWNHFLAFTQRMKEGHQNDMEFTDDPVITSDDHNKVEEFLRNLDDLNPEQITAFEKYLFAIYIHKSLERRTQ